MLTVRLEMDIRACFTVETVIIEHFAELLPCLRVFEHDYVFLS